MDRGAWRVTVHGVAKSLHDRSDLACTHACRKQIGNSLAVQWLRLDTLTAVKSLGSIPGWGIKIP